MILEKVPTPHIFSYHPAEGTRIPVRRESVCCKVEVAKVARQKFPGLQGRNPRKSKGAIESLTGSPLPFWCYSGTEGEGMEDVHNDPGP